MPKKKTIELSIIIVYYGGYENLIGLLDSIKNRKTRTIYEIILVNNKIDENITERIKKKYVGVRLIKSPGNIGYAKGNNLGIKYSKGKYLMIVNPDTEFKKGSVDSLVSFLENNKNTAIIAPNLIYKSGKFLENIGTLELTPVRGIFALSILNKLFPDNPWSRDYYLKDISKKRLREVDVVPGTAFVIRKDVFDIVKGFDGNFFLYFEEADICRRIKKLGYKIFITPKVTLIHDWSPADGGATLKKIYEKSRFYYFQKHFGLLNAFIVELATRISKKALFSTIAILIIVLIVIYKLNLHLTSLINIFLS